MVKTQGQGQAKKASIRAWVGAEVGQFCLGVGPEAWGVVGQT